MQMVFGFSGDESLANLSAIMPVAGQDADEAAPFVDTDTLLLFPLDPNDGPFVPLKPRVIEPPSPEEVVELEQIHDAAVDYYEEMFRGRLEEAGMVLVGDSDATYADDLETLIALTHDVEGLDPAYAAFAIAECERFQAYMVDVDPASRVAWTTADGGLNLYIGGHDPSNTIPIHQAIVGNSTLLGQSGIQAWGVSHNDRLVRVFIPYEGAIELEEESLLAG